MQNVFQFILDLIREVKLYLFLIVIVLLLRGSISYFIKKIKEINYKDSTKNIGITTDTDSSVGERTEEVQSKSENTVYGNNDDQIDLYDDFRSVIILLRPGNFINAEVAFNIYIEGKDVAKIYYYKAIFLYFAYVKANYCKALTEIERIYVLCGDENDKMHILHWWMSCFKKFHEYDKQLKVLCSVKSDFSNEENITQVIVLTSNALVASGKCDEALNVLRNRLSAEISDPERASVYAALSLAEKENGNAVMGALCLEKATEYRPNDLGVLFDTAYEESENSFYLLSLYNYNIIVESNEKNASAMNNLGVCCDKVGLKLKSCDFYQSASELSESLAFANMGNRLLNAGFHSLAEEYASKGLSYDNPNEEVHSLKARIAQLRISENIKWSSALANSLKLKRLIQKYVEMYYIDVQNNIFDGEWSDTSGNVFTIKHDCCSISSTWTVERYPEYAITTGIFGTYKNSYFDNYTIKGTSSGMSASLFFLMNSTEPVGLLGSTKSFYHTCLSFYSSDNNEWIIFSTDSTDYYYSTFKKVK